MMNTKPLHNDTAQSLRDRLAALSDEEVFSLRYPLINIEKSRTTRIRLATPSCASNAHDWQERARSNNGKSGSAKITFECNICPKVAYVTTGPWRSYPDTGTGRIYGSPLGRLTVGEIMDAVKYR